MVTVGDSVTERELMQRVYEFPRTCQGFDEDDSAGFLLMFYPRIRQLMRKYKPVGSSFDAYLNTSMRWQLRSYAARRKSAKIRLATESSPEVAGEIHEFSPELVTGSPDDPGSARAAMPRSVSAPDPREITALPRRPPTRTPKVSLSPKLPPTEGGLTPGEAQRVLLLALKGAATLDMTECESLADTLGCDKDWLLGVWEQLRGLCDENLQRRARAREKRDRAWFRVRCLQAHLRETLEPNERARFEKRLALWQSRLRVARRKAQVIPVAPTHQQIADQLNVPKGTVDSSIFRIRQEIEDPSFLRRLASVFDTT